MLQLEGLSIAPGKENQKSVAQCTAFVKLISKTNIDYKAQIWTARHCLPDFSSRILNSQLYLFDGSSGYVKVNPKLTLATARNEFFALVEREIPAFLDAEKKQKNPARIVLDYAFLEEEGKKNYGTECIPTDSSESVTDNSLCAALQDFRVFDATLHPSGSVGIRILDELLKREQISSKKLEKSAAQRWALASAKQIEFELDVSRARFVDIFLQCGENAPSAVCRYKSTVEALARKWRAPGRDLLAEASKDGFDQPGRSYAEFKRNLAANHFKNELTPLFRSIQSSIQTNPSQLIFAGNFVQQTGSSMKFSSAPLVSFYPQQSSQLNFKFWMKDQSRDAFLRFESPAGKTLVLSQGDSGSTLLLEENVPFLVMTAKGKNSISGGSAILALPEISDEDANAKRRVSTIASCK